MSNLNANDPAVQTFIALQDEQGKSYIMIIAAVVCV